MTRWTRRALLTGAPALLLAKPCLADTLRGLRGDWSLAVPEGWQGNRSDWIDRVMRSTTDGKVRLLGQFWMFSARSADAILTNEENPLAVIAINSTARGAKSALPSGQEVWKFLFRDEAQERGIANYRVVSTWAGRARPGPDVASAIWSFDAPSSDAWAGNRASEEFVFISRPDRITWMKLRATTDKLEACRPGLWQAVRTIHFDEER